MSVSQPRAQDGTAPGSGAERVADGVWLLRGRPRYAINVYVMGDVLVDAATRHASKRILSKVRDVRLSAHALTHGHLDHTGASHEICQTLGLPLMCGEAERPVVESGQLGVSDPP